MFRIASLFLVSALACCALSQNLTEIEMQWNSDGPLADGGSAVFGGPGPYTYSLGGLGCGINLTGSQTYLYGKTIARATADWTGFPPFHTTGFLQSRSQERIGVGTLSGGPIEVMTLVDFTMTVNTGARTDFVNLDMEGGNKYGTRFEYFAQDLTDFIVTANWEGKAGPIGEFVSTPSYSVRTLSPTAKQLVFKRTYADPRNVDTFRAVTSQVQAGNPNGPNFVEVVADAKVRYKATQPDGYITGQTDHTGSLLDRVVVPPIILSGTKRNATVYLSNRSGVDRKVFLKAVPTQMTTNVTVPAYVIIPAGQTSKLFGINVLNAPVAGNVKIMAVHDSKLVTGTVLATPFPIANLDVNPSIIHGGQTSNGSVMLAPGVVGPVQLSVDKPVVTLEPSTLPMPFGGTGLFDVGTAAVTSNQLVTLTAMRDIYTLTKTLTIVPASRIQGMSVTPTVVVGGNPSTAKATLFGPAPLGGASIQVTSTSPFAIVPATILVPQAATNQTATITTLPTTVGRTAVIVGLLNGVSKTATLTISP
ncbi:MAG: hypothetical protein ABL949_07915 [Fimbriimonadaceae bacterium]